MRKLQKSILGCALGAALLMLGGMTNAFATTTDALSPVLIYGQATKEAGNKLFIKNSNPNVGHQEVIVTTSGEHTRILDAVTGYPVSYDNIRDGETVYAYVGPAMTLSLPPMANASLVLCNIPADYKVPEFITVSSLEFSQDKSTATLKSTSGQTYTIPADTEIIPYLTRNMVTVNDLTPGTTCLIWSTAGNTNTTAKIVIFPAEVTPSYGWKQENGNWYFYNENGQLHSGWLQDGRDWYYLNPETHIMHTGFLMLDGKTYYLQDNGKMLTAAHTFTPDSNGELH